jgi:L-asparagine oxygenase
MEENQERIEFNHREREKLKNLALSITAYPSVNPEEFCQQCKQLAVLVPERIQQALKSFIEKGSKKGFLLLDTWTIEDSPLPPTPKDNTEKTGEQTLLARIQAIIIGAIGDMIAYEAEGYGRLFQDIVPNQHMSEQQTSLGSGKELEIHTEQAFSQLRPDVLSLACLRGDSMAVTYVLPVSLVVEHLNERERELLWQPLWKTGVDLSFKIGAHEFLEGDIRGPMAILSGSREDPKLCFDQDLMFGLTEEAHSIVGKIVGIYYSYRYGHCLQPGQILLVDNRRAVHGRSPFFPRYDGYDRFLVRCFGVLDFEKSRYARSLTVGEERTVQAIYS